MKILAVIPARYASTRFPGKTTYHHKGQKYDSACI
jgi:CMP-2-keto-3-deoxyoctulosonic acid synthetase